MVQSLAQATLILMFSSLMLHVLAMRKIFWLVNISEQTLQCVLTHVMLVYDVFLDQVNK